MTEFDSQNSTEGIQKAFDALDLTKGFPEDYPGGAERNTYRASLVMPALVAYCEHNGGLTSEPIEAVIQDVLADLHHLTDLLDVSFDGLNDAAERRYLEEVAGE